MAWKTPTAALLGGGSADPQTLQDVTDVGNTTTNSIQLLDPSGELRGLIGADDFYGLVLAGRDTSDNKTPITIDGSTNLLSSEQLALVFNGAANGDFLRLTTKTDINGQDVFLVGSTPLDVVEYSESFTFNSADIELTANYQLLIDGITANQYRADTSQAITSFRLVNRSNNQTADVEYYITVNGAAPTPDDLQITTVPQKDGVAIVSFDDTTQTTVNIGDTVQVYARQTTGSFGDVFVEATVYTTTLDMVQNATLQNIVQNTDDVGANSELSISTYNRLTGGDTFTLPKAIDNHSPSKPFGLYIKNISGGDVNVLCDPTDVIYTATGPSPFFTIKNGEAFKLATSSANSYDIISNYSAGGGMPESPDDGGFYLGKSNNWSNIYNALSYNSFYWSTDTSATQPPPFTVKGNNSDYSQITELYIDVTSLDGQSMANIINFVGVGDALLISQIGARANYFNTLAAVKATDNGGWFTIPVVAGSVQGSIADGAIVTAGYSPVGARTSISAIADTTYTISDNGVTPSNLEGFNVIGVPEGLMLDPTDGSIRNITGRTVSLTGSISFQPTREAGQSPQVHLASARSTDKVNWTYNQDSHREWEIAGNSESVINTTSFFADVNHLEYVKFTCFSTGGDVEFTNKSQTFEGQNVSGFTVLLTLKES